MDYATRQARREVARAYDDTDDEPWVDVDDTVGVPPTSTSPSFLQADEPRSPVEVGRERGPRARRQPVRRETEPLSQQCWICYDDAGDAPLLHVCSCTLVGHQDCLLQWLETQAASSPQASGPKCPVCATPIVVKEERSEALRLYRQFRRKVDQLSLAAAVGGVTASGWFVSAAYGAWVVKVFMGEQVAQALLLRHDGGLPWRYWLNLPIIPFALILSRTPLVDSLLPFLPLTLVLSTHTTSPRSILLSLSDPLGLDDLTLRYPPSPTLTVCLLPWLRLFYLRLRMKVFNAVLGKKKKYRGLAGVFEEAAEDELTAVDINDPERREPLELVAALEVEVEDGPARTGEARAQRRSGQQDEAADAEAAPAAAAAAGAEEPDAQAQALPLTSRLRVGFGRLTSLILGALIFPALSSMAGSALFWLACRNSSAKPLRLLRRILGVTAVAAATRGVGAGGFGMGGAGILGGRGGTSWLRSLILSPSSSGRGMSPLVDPVWVRNSIGAGLVLLLRDAVELTAGLLENRRKKSRKVVEQPFNPGSGRGTPPPPMEPEPLERVGSGGRNGRGREAVVHNML
ncbi:hypothetical protein JCM11251_007672 [Rhodosporidiobolus azoricus]